MDTNERQVSIVAAICISTVVFLLLVVIFSAFTSTKLNDYDCVPMTDLGDDTGAKGDNTVVHGKWASRGEE